MTRAGIAIFARTPGMSPAKTRLARDIGRPKAEAVYAASLTAAKRLYRDAEKRGYTVFFVMAEPHGFRSPFWRGYRARPSGAGGLGMRLHITYDFLIRRFPAAMLIGTDTPHMTADIFDDALTALERRNVAVAPADDGGFALFAGRAPLASSVWNGVRYSTDTTLAQLCRALPQQPARLRSFIDIDTAQDIRRLLGAPATREAMPRIVRALFAEDGVLSERGGEIR